MPKQLNNIRFNGSFHHYHLDYGLFVLLERFPDHAEVQSLREELAKFPDDLTEHAARAIKVLHSLKKSIPDDDYGNIFYLLNSVKQHTPHQQKGT